MNNLTVKIKKLHEKAVIPTYAKEGDAEWVDIIGYEGLYQINKLGQIQSIRKSTKPRLIKQHKNKKGYLVVKLYLTKNEKKNYSVHRLMAKQFIPNSNGYKQVNHIDGNPSNNTVTNLEWVNNRQNMNHRYSTLQSIDGRYGIYWDKTRCKWETYIHINGKKKHIGRFENKEEAYDEFYKSYTNIHNVNPW